MKYEAREMNDTELDQADLEAVTGGGAAALAARNTVLKWLGDYEDRVIQLRTEAYQRLGTGY